MRKSLLIARTAWLLTRIQYESVVDIRTPNEHRQPRKPAHALRSDARVEPAFDIRHNLFLADVVEQVVEVPVI